MEEKAEMTDVEKLKAWLDEQLHLCEEIHPTCMDGPKLLDVCQILLGVVGKQCDRTRHELFGLNDCGLCRAIADALKIVESK